MDEELQIIVQATLEVDTDESVSKIIKQMPEIEKLVNARSKIKLQVELDDQEVKSQTQKIVNQLKNTKSLDLGNAFKFDTSNMQTLYKQLDDYVQKLKELNGFSDAKYSVKTSNTGEINSAKITYYNDALKETVTQTYALDKANEETVNSISKLSLVSTDYSSNLRALDQEQKRQIENDLKVANGKAELAKQMDILITKSNKAGLSLDSQNQADFSNKLNNATTISELQEISHYIKMAKLEYQELNAQMSKDMPNSAIDNLGKKITNATTAINLLDNKFKTLGTSIPNDLSTQFTNLRIQLQQIEGMTDAKEKVTAYSNFEKQLIKVNNAYKELVSSQKQINTGDKFMSDKTVLSNRVEAWMKDNTKAAKIYATQLKELQERISQVTTKDGLSKVKNDFREMQTLAAAQGNLGRTMTGELTNNFQKFTSWFSLGTLVAGSLGQISAAIEELKQIDTILTEVSKTSDRTAASLKKLGDTSFEEASKFGVKASGYLLGVQEMSRAGFGEKQSENLAQLSVLAQSAGDMTAELANQYLIATNFAYGYNGSLEKLNAVLDSQNQITNRNALNMTDLANATKVAGSQASQSGVDIDELTAAVGTMMAVTQQGGNIAGRAFKGILMNIQAVSGETEDGDILDEESFKKVEKRCESLGVSLEEVHDGMARLRDPMLVLKELAAVYNSLPDDSADKAGIISDIGGKYRGNQLAALLGNWDTYEKMLLDYQNSTGSALAEAQKTADSWEGRLNQLANSWTDFVQNFVNSDLVKGGITIADSLISGLDSLSSTLGTIPTLVSAASIALSMMGKNAGRTEPFMPLLLKAA